MEREIILDTETTGLDPKDGHRVIEIGCVELVNRLPTGKTFHTYLNPEREVDAGAVAIHGLTTEFLKDKPKFSEVADDFIKFIGDSKVVIHNADFDVKFLNAELFFAKKPAMDRSKIFCTLIHARKKFPGQQNSLDALCRRFGVDNSHRTYHGALLDSEILADVYLELMGGRQNTIALTSSEPEKVKKVEVVETVVIPVDFAKRDFPISDEEAQRHNEFVSKMSNSLWAKTESESSN